MHERHACIGLVVKCQLRKGCRHTSAGVSKHTIPPPAPPQPRNTRTKDTMPGQTASRGHKATHAGSAPNHPQSSRLQRLQGHHRPRRHGCHAQQQRRRRSLRAGPRPTHTHRRGKRFTAPCCGAVYHPAAAPSRHGSTMCPRQTTFPPPSPQKRLLANNLYHSSDPDRGRTLQVPPPASALVHIRQQLRRVATGDSSLRPSYIGGVQTSSRPSHTTKVPGRPLRRHWLKSSSRRTQM